MWVKTLSVILPIILLALVQLSHSRDSRSAKQLANWGGKCLLPTILVLNISEATFTDFFYGNLFNGFIGLTLIASIPRDWDYDENNILGFTKDAAWPILYTLWNIHFVLANYLTIKLNADLFPLILILFLALIYAAYHKKWHLWLMARAYSLYLFCLIGSFFPQAYPQIAFSGLNYFANDLLNILSTISLIYLVHVYSKQKVNCLVYSRRKNH